MIHFKSFLKPFHMIFKTGFVASRTKSRVRLDLFFDQQQWRSIEDMHFNAPILTASPKFAFTQADRVLINAFSYVYFRYCGVQLKNTNKVKCVFENSENQLKCFT